MRVCAVVPWRGGCEHRERAWAWVSEQYDFPVVVAESPPGPWVKALAAMPAIERSEAEIIVLADADVWTEGTPAAIEAVEAGAPWAIPHTGVFRLNRKATDTLIETGEWNAGELTQRPYKGIAGGGILVAPRSTLLDIPLDSRFVGWGQEDCSHGLALWHLAGQPWRGKQPLIHLFHEPAQRLSRRYGSVAGRKLYQRYCEAARNGTLETIIEEAKLANAHQPQLHADPARAVG